MNKCLEIPGWKLFQYFDKKGYKQRIESVMVNDYLYVVCNEYFTVKDFRIWAASVVFVDTLFDIKPAEDEKQKDKNILQCYDAAAKALGNAKNVCRKYYVHPVLSKSYKNGAIKKAFQILNHSENPGQNFSKTQHALLFLLEQFKPGFVKKIRP